MRSARASYGSNAAMPRPRSRLPAMRDIAFVAFLFAFIGVGFRKPFLFILAYCYIDIVAPQRLSYFLINSIPISLRSEEHTSELQSLMRISYAVFCLKKKNKSVNHILYHLLFFFHIYT